ncbi:MAG TPA: TIGR03086 family metal-binding protein [Actinophytocola sp.]|uniref:TIGR03086 family metal-binding protein n=1 Tax=Actinophytocola sp. TaxID=1872138 RepID=UPI002DDD6ED7|nr:TIGR03086 family metal-binding protein [Actinophytocola sp.]HEV2779665.1 TIGR03086 family metal-binding protein [Actinophytocola sp.]
MDPRTTVNLYYDAWRNRAGDMTGVPLADDFTFTGPVASFTSADGFREMAIRAGAAVRGFHVRHQFADGDLVCSVIDWEMAMLPGVLTAAELLEVRDGTIVRGELIYDAEDLRRAMAPKPVVDLLERSLSDTADLVGTIDAAGWAAPSRCAGWTVRQTGNHLVGGLTLLARIVEGDAVDPSELDAQRMADTDHLGADPAAAVRGIAKRILAAFGNPETLERRFPLPAPDVPGQAIANICLLESLIHGWDIAAGAGVAYHPDPAAIAAVRDFAAVTVGDEQRARGLFGPPVPTPPDADPFTATLGFLGRRA